MTTLPAELTYGYVEGHYLLAVADGPDAGRLPDAKGAAGEVSLTPLNPTTMLYTDGKPVDVVTAPVKLTLNSEGRLTDPEGAVGVWVPAGAYTVKYAITGVSKQAHTIEVLPEHTEATPLFLNNAAPPGGPVLSPSEYAELSARIDAIGTGGGGTDLTNYSQVSGLAGYPDTFPPDLSGVSAADVGARPDDWTPDLSGYATTSALSSGLAGKQDAGDYVTATELSTALSGKADSGDLATVATTGSYDDLDGAPTIPTQPSDIGAQPAGSYATAAQGAKADTAVQPAAIADFITAEDVPAAPNWGNIDGRPAVIAAGATQANARAAIGAGTSNLAIGTTGSTAKAGDYTPSVADVPNLPASKVTSGTFDAARIPALPYATQAQGDKADTAVQPADLTDYVTTEDLPAPATAIVYYNGTNWIGPDDTTATVRPNAQRVMAFGGTTQPTFLVSGDVWVEDTGA